MFRSRRRMDFRKAHSAPSRARAGFAGEGRGWNTAKLTLAAELLHDKRGTKHWVAFEVAQGLEKLRELIAKLEPGHGIQLHGHVGLTSHIADVIRKASVPARMTPGKITPTHSG